MTDAPDRIREALAQITGPHAQVRHGGQNLFALDLRGEGMVLVRRFGRGRWDLTREQVPLSRGASVLPLRARGVGPVLRLWDTPLLSQRDRDRELVRLVDRYGYPVRADAPLTGAQVTFAVNLSSQVIYPNRSDGRFAFAGCTEPSPGCWPTGAVVAAQRGDLAALWPYLGRPGTSGPLGAGEHSTDR